jgi:hypothetical protein
MAAYDKYWDSVSVERSLLSDSFVEGKMEGVTQMILNGYKAGATIEFLAEMAQLSPDKVRHILSTHQKS